MTAANPSSLVWDAKMRGCLGQLATPKAEGCGVLTTPFPWVATMIPRSGREGGVRILLSFSSAALIEPKMGS
jgi:hypothetical protein